MTLDALVPSTDPCPVVALEWDRGHEAFDAIVRLDGRDAMVVTEIHDLWPQAGCLWIRRDEILTADPIPEESHKVRVLDHLGVRGFAVDPVLGDLGALLRTAQDEQALVAVHSTSTGSSEMLVGRVRSVGGGRLDLDEIDPTGARTDEPLDYRIDEIIAVQWGTDYLRALALLAEG